MGGAARVARAPGKLVLLGEYAVLAGAEAWVTAVDRFVETRADARLPAGTVSAVSDGKSRVEAVWKDGRWQVAEPGWRLAAEALTAGWGKEAPGLIVDSTAFYLSAKSGRLEKAGFGSSAAVVVSMLALALGEGKPEKLLKLARQVHHSAQGGMGSGIDIAASVYGGTLRYRVKDEAVSCSPQPLPQDLRILTVWTGDSASTPQLIGRVNAWRATDGRGYDALMERMGGLASDGLAAAAENDSAGVIESAVAYGAAMRELGIRSGAPIVTSLMDELQALVGRKGAVKPSGAGGGDVALVFTKAAEVPELVDKLVAKGVTLLDLAYQAPGAALLEQESACA